MSKIRTNLGRVFIIVFKVKYKPQEQNKAMTMGEINNNIKNIPECKFLIFALFIGNKFTVTGGIE